MKRSAFCALGALFNAACGDVSDVAPLTLGSLEQALSDPASVLDFENVADWNVTQGVKSASTERSRGGASLAIHGFTFTTVTSVPLPTPTGITGTLALDLKVPASPAWGEVQVFVSIPSQNLFEALVGQVTIAALPSGQFNTLTFDVPPTLLSRLQASYQDLRLKIALNAPQTTDGYLLDNLRFVGPAAATKVEIEVTGGGDGYGVDDFVYASVDGLRRKVWAIGDPDQNTRFDASHWFGAGSHLLRLQAINTGGPVRYGIRVWVNDSLFLDEQCPASLCNGADRDEGISFDRSVQIATPNRPASQSVRLTSSAPGKLYIDHAFTGVTTTGTSEPVSVALPPGEYTLGLGVSQDLPPNYTGRYHERRVTVATSPVTADLTSTPALSFQESTRIAIIPIRQFIVDQLNQTAVMPELDVQNFRAQAFATRDEWLEPFSYGLVTWDIDYLPVVEDTPLHAPVYSNIPDTDQFLEDAGLEHLRQEYELVVFYYDVSDANGTILRGVVDGQLRDVNASAWGGGGQIWINTLWARSWAPTGPNAALLHEALHNYEEYNRWSLGYYNGIQGLHGDAEHGYYPGDGGEVDFAKWQRAYIRGQSAEVIGMRQELPWPAPEPRADLWVGVFDTMRLGYRPTPPPVATLAARSAAAAPVVDEPIECRHDR